MDAGDSYWFVYLSDVFATDSAVGRAVTRSYKKCGYVYAASEAGAWSCSLNTIDI